MPKLLPATEHQRVAQAIEVLSLITAGISQAEACRKVGISIDQYRFWITRGEETIEAMRQAVNAIQRIELDMILASEERSLRMLIDDMTNPDLNAKDRLSIRSYLDKRLDQLLHDQGASGVTEDAAAEYLKGPTLSKGSSRLRASTVNVKPQPDGSVDITTFQDDDILDMRFTPTTVNSEEDC